MKRLICGIAILMATICVPAQAATVSFLGLLNNGVAGPVLGTVPRNFVLTLNYPFNAMSPSVGSVAASGQFDFPAVPNPVVGPVAPQLGVSASTSGILTIFNNNGMFGSDAFSFTGVIPAGVLAPNANPVNYSFTFLKPNTTISSNQVSPSNIEKLIAGQTSIAFANPQITANGSIRGAPEPSTMIALTGLVAGGCGIGYRRRMKSKATEEADGEEG